MGSSTSSAGEMATLAFSQSSTDIVPSGRSAMICTTGPWLVEIFTRTSR